MKRRRLSRNRVIIAGINLSYAFFLRFSMRKKYESALSAYNSEKYEMAKDEFEKILNYQDSKSYYAKSQRMIEKEKKYQKALDYMDEENYDRAIAIFEDLEGYKDSKEKIAEIKDRRYAVAYKQAIRHYRQGQYKTAIVEFKVLGDYKDTYGYLEKCYSEMRIELSETISAGSMYSVALTDDQKVLFSGDVDDGQNGLNQGDYTSISAGGYYTIGLYGDGSVDVAGDISWMHGYPHSKWKNVMQVSSGFDFVAVLFEDGTVDFQGQNSDKNYEEVLDFVDWKDIAMIDAGYHMVVGLDYGGNIHVTGRNASSIKSEIESNIEKWKDIISVATGGTSKSSEGFVVGLKADGTVVTAGKTQYGINEAQNWTNIKKISAGDYHLVGINMDGKPVAVMNDNPNERKNYKDACCKFNQWPENAEIVNISAGNGMTLGLSADGTVYSSGFDLQNQIPESGKWTGVKVYGR